MFFKKRKIKVRKYHKNPFKTYEPEKRIEINKEQAMPLFLRIAGWFLFLGGMISFFVSSLLMGIRGIFGIRDKKREIFRGKTVEMRVKNSKK